MLLEVAESVAKAGADMLRGGAYKPRTSPYEFQGLGVRGLKYLAEAREKTGLPVVTELMGLLFVLRLVRIDVLIHEGGDVGQPGFALGRELIGHAAIVAPGIRTRYSEARKSSSAALTSSDRSCWVQ